MKYIKKTILVFAVLAGVAVGMVGSIFAGERMGLFFGPNGKTYADPDFKIEKPYKKPNYKKNRKGETYGSSMDVEPEDEPDLIAVEGDNGGTKVLDTFTVDASENVEGDSGIEKN